VNFGLAFQLNLLSPRWRSKLNGALTKKLLASPGRFGSGVRFTIFCVMELIRVAGTS
jgi:hypothetical protein